MLPLITNTRFIVQPATKTKASIKDCYIIVNYSLTRDIILMIIKGDSGLFAILIIVILI